MLHVQLINTNVLIRGFIVHAVQMDIQDVVVKGVIHPWHVR